MQAVHSQIYFHFIWGTWNRLDLIDREIETTLYRFIHKKTKVLNGIPIELGGTTNHIHLLVKLTPSIPIWEFVKNIKGSSSHYINQIKLPVDFFKWQGGYAGTSVSPSQVSKISRYIQMQKYHHQEDSIIRKWELFE